jgi:hypothetical protein
VTEISLILVFDKYAKTFKQINKTGITEVKEEDKEKK